MKIAIAGIGGVGGYVGGMLARHFQHSDQVEIYFIARGENEKAIRENGLQLHTSGGNYLVRPKMTTSDTSLIGPVDLLICCTKSYDIKTSLLQCSPCIKPETVILPLLNGVDGRRLISEVFPSNPSWDGCIYIISRLMEAGVVKESGNSHKLYFGSGHPGDKQVKQVGELFREAGINAHATDNIQQLIWEKFVFIAPIATLTSYLDDCIGNMLSDPAKSKLLHALLPEVKALADGKHIPLPENIIQLSLDKIAALPFETTSSMHGDFKRGRSTELESLCGYVVKESAALGLSAPTFNMMYSSLQNKIPN